MKVLSELISSSSLFPPKICRIPSASHEAEQQYSAASEAAPAALSDHRMTPGFCLTKRRVLAGRLDDSLGGFFSSVIMEHNKVKCETAAYERAFFCLRNVFGSASPATARPRKWRDDVVIEISTHHAGIIVWEELLFYYVCDCETVKEEAAHVDGDYVAPIVRHHVLFSLVVAHSKWQPQADAVGLMFLNLRDSLLISAQL